MIGRSPKNRRKSLDLQRFTSTPNRYFGYRLFAKELQISLCKAGRARPWAWEPEDLLLT